MTIASTLDKQKKYFLENAPFSLAQRRQNLQKFKSVYLQHLDELVDALKQDLGRSAHESYLVEILPLTFEIDRILHNFASWTKKKKIKTSLFLWPASSYIEPQAYGQTLIIAPWNYPLLLLLAPMLGAIAAGNTVMLAPAVETVHTMNVLKKIVRESFPTNMVDIIDSGPDGITQALEIGVNYIFFTGSPRVGKIIMSQAAKHLTPVTLELGGKSPCFIHEDADLKLAARRLVWGKFTNSGQTCVAPDYAMIHENIYPAFKQLLIDEIHRRFSEPHSISLKKFKIINKKNWQRLVDYFKEAQIIMGGQYEQETLGISPTLVESPQSSHPLSQEEIFGPILPLYTYKDIHEEIDKIRQQEKPLAFYCFSQDKKIQESLSLKTYSGSLVFNDCVVQTGSSRFPFGGVGQSGMGVYHGQKSIDTFSHYKPVLKRSYKFDASFRYPPWNYPLRILKFIAQKSRFLFFID